MKSRSIVFFVLACAAFGQSPASPRFEVASIKPSKLGPETRGTGLVRTAPGGRFTAEGGLVGSLTSMAYGLRPYQVLGGPDWINFARYDIEAKAEGNATPQQIRLMLQSLLEDRFKLRLHRETRELPVYELVVAKGGPRIKLSEVQNPVAGPPPSALRGGELARGQMRGGRGDLQANAVLLTALAQALSGELDRPVLDKTELKGLYDFGLRWTPELGQGPVPLGGPDSPSPPVDASAPSIFTALQEQLGLKLEAARRPVEVLVIDSVEKPTEN